MIIRLLAVLFCLVSQVIANDGLRYYVFDETRTEKLHYELTYDFTIYDSPGSAPRLVFSTEYRIYACAQDSFTYTVESSGADISREQLTKLIAAIREISTQKLQPKQRRGEESEWTQGWLNIDDHNYSINARPDEPERAKLHTLILNFLDLVSPKSSRQVTSRTIEGDLFPVRPVTFETLLKSPKQYDGKRVRLMGYYHHEFENSNFGPTKKADYKESVWLGNASTFAKPSSVQRLNDMTIIAEGTFNAGSGGHMGLWPGSLDRVTRISQAP